jgi:hypothetical protein
MTKPEVFGLPKWLTEPEAELLASSFRNTFDVLITPADFFVSTRAASAVDLPGGISAVGIQVTAQSSSPYFGQTHSHYAARQSYETYFNVADGDHPKPPYFLATSGVDFDVADVLAELKETYGLDLGFTDVDYNYGDLISSTLSFPLELKIADESFRYKPGKFPVYCAPDTLQPLIRMINPGRFLPGYRDLVIDPDTDVASPGELQYFSVNGTRDHAYLQTLQTGQLFEEEFESWDFGNRYLIPHQAGEAEGWTSSRTPRFQNVFGAKVLYNGVLRTKDVRPVNPKLTHTLILRLDPAYSKRAIGLIRLFYRLVEGEEILLSSVILVTNLNGLTYEGSGEIPLPSIVQKRRLFGLLYNPFTGDYE